MITDREGVKVKIRKFQYDIIDIQWSIVSYQYFLDGFLLAYNNKKRTKFMLLSHFAGVHVPGFQQQRQLGTQTQIKANILRGKPLHTNKQLDQQWELSKESGKKSWTNMSFVVQAHLNNLYNIENKGSTWSHIITTMLL